MAPKHAPLIGKMVGFDNFKLINNEIVWDKTKRANKLRNRFPLSISHIKRKDGSVYQAKLGFSRSVRLLFKDYAYMNILYSKSKNTLGLQFTNKEDENSYKLSDNLHTGQSYISATMVLKHIEPRGWRLDEIAYDKKNVCLVLPIKLISGFDEGEIIKNERKIL